MNNIDLSKKGMFLKFSSGVFLNILLKIKSLIFLPILVNVFSKSEFGIFSLFFTVASVLIPAFTVNLPDSANRVVLNLHKKNDHLSIAQLISSIINFIFIWSVFLSLVAFLTYYFILKNPIENFFPTLLTIVLTLIFFKLAIFTYQIFLQTKKILLSQIFVEYGSLFIMIFLIYFLSIDSPQIIAMSGVPLSIFTSLYLIYKLNKEYSLQAIIDKKLIKQVFDISFYLLPSAYILVIIKAMDSLMVKYYLLPEQLGEYSFALSLSMAIPIAFSAGINFFWLSSSVYSDHKHLIETLRKATQLTCIAMLAVLGFYFFATPKLINLINPDYSNTFNVIQILIVGFFLSANINFFSGTLIAIKKEKYIFYTNIIFLAINFLLNLYLIPIYGLGGAALSTSLTYIGIYISQYFIVKKTLDGFSSFRTDIFLYTSIIIGFIFIFSHFSIN